ncbi:unnamed protein product, partial [Polarella glacialis]
ASAAAAASSALEAPPEALRSTPNSGAREPSSSELEGGGHSESCDARSVGGEAARAVSSKASPKAERPDPAGPGGSGEADALFCSGHCHEHGLHGCPVDLTAAAEMYQLAAEEGHTVAQWRLGELLEFGRGAETSEPDEAKAAHWYRLAAEEGYAQAQSALALLLEDGRGVPQDEAAALRWHLAAAEQGQAVSQYCAACCLAAGRGCQADSVAAEQWARRSAEQGFGPAVRALRDLGLGLGLGLEAAAEDRRPEASSGPFDPDYDAEEGRPRASSVPSVPSVLVQADLGNDSNDLLGLAQRIALQLGGLDEAEASELLDELLAEVPSLGLQELLEHGADEMEARPMVSHA